MEKVLVQYALMVHLVVLQSDLGARLLVLIDLIY